MDPEDRLFVRVVGDKALRSLRAKNVKLYQLFVKACDENGENPAMVLGRTLLKFAKGLIDGDDFVEDLMSRSIKIGLAVKKEKISESLKELIDIRKEFMDTESSKLDSLIEEFIKKELTKSTSSPMDLLKTEDKRRIVIDKNLLAMMPEEQLDALIRMAVEVKGEKMKSRELTSEDVEKVVGGGIGEEKEESQRTENDKDNVPDTEGSEQSG